MFGKKLGFYDFLFHLGALPPVCQKFCNLWLWVGIGRLCDLCTYLKCMVKNIGANLNNIQVTCSIELLQPQLNTISMVPIYMCSHSSADVVTRLADYRRHSHTQRLNIKSCWYFAKRWLFCKLKRLNWCCLDFAKHRCYKT